MALFVLLLQMVTLAFFGVVASLLHYIADS